MKRFLILFICLSILLMSYVSTAVCDSQFDGVAIGDTVFFGRYEQDGDGATDDEPLSWIVLDVVEDMVLLISEYAIDGYECSFPNEGDGCWATSKIRRWMNEELVNEMFDDIEQLRIAGIDIAGANGDRVFLPDTNMIVGYSDMGILSLNCSPTAYAVSRGVSTDPCFWYVVVADEGWFVYCGPEWGMVTDDPVLGIRPMVWVLTGEISGGNNSTPETEDDAAGTNITHEDNNTPEIVETPAADDPGLTISGEEVACPSCGAVYDAGEVPGFCIKCGLPMTASVENEVSVEDDFDLMLAIAAGEKVTCPSCGAVYDAGETPKFCIDCGASMTASETVVCPNCRTEYPVDGGYKFCIECGTSLTAASVPEPEMIFTPEKEIQEQKPYERNDEFTQSSTENPYGAAGIVLVDEDTLIRTSPSMDASGRMIVKSPTHFYYSGYENGWFKLALGYGEYGYVYESRCYAEFTICPGCGTRYLHHVHDPYCVYCGSALIDKAP